MSLFAISDLHLSLSTDKQMNIFRGWENYVEKIEKNWREMINDEDTVVLPGDISWEMRINKVDADFGFINSLPGKKIILKGNHDLWWDSVTKMDKCLAQRGFDRMHFLHNNYYAYEDYAICGSRGWFFDDTDDKKILMREVGRIKTSVSAAVNDGFEPILFLHYPPRTTNAVCPEVMQVIEEYGITRCFYGHIHRGGAYSAVNATIDGCLYKCVSCDMMDFVPYKIL